MSAREADEVRVVDDPRGGDRAVVTVVHGRYETSLNVSAGELVRLRAAIDAHLSIPPADDVREALIGGIARDEQDWRFGDFEETSNHSPSLAEYIADGILANPLFEVRPRGTVSPPADDVREALAQVLYGNEHGRTSFAHKYTWHQETADAILSRFDVRPRGTVTPPADHVREALAEAQRLAQLRLARITQLLSRLGEVHYCPEHGDLLAGMRSARCSESHSAEQVRASVRQVATVIPTPEEWAEQMDAERALQIAHGYDDAHDAERGAAHLLNWAIDYARRGNSIAAATMTRCALRLPPRTSTEPQVEAAARAMFEDPLTPGDGYTWAEMVTEDPSRADIWREDARRVLAAAEAARLS